MKRFADLYYRLDATPSVNAKLAALRDYFAAARPENAVWALHLLTDKVRRRTLTSRKLQAIYLSFSGMPEWLFVTSKAHVGDGAETVTLLLRTSSLPPAPRLDLPLCAWMENEIPRVKTLAESEVQATVLRWWGGLEDRERFVLNKILTGSFRVGASGKLAVRALSEVLGVDKAVLTHRLMGDFPTTPEFYLGLGEAETERPPSQPYPFLLAYPYEVGVIDEAALGDWQVEWKWDGVRAQVIKRESDVYIWSRGEDDVTGQFPDLVEKATALPDGTVLDGEVVAWNERARAPHPFNVLQTRLGRKKVSKAALKRAPLQFLVYDLLETGGEDIRSEAFALRRGRLTALFEVAALSGMRLTEALELSSLADLERHRQRAREVGAEGLMIKRLGAPYEVGRKRGIWFKHKVDPYTLDAVLIYAQAGTGRRANLFTDYTFALWQEGELVPFAKAYSGLTDKEIARLDHWIRRHTLERFGPVRSVEASQVFELAFEGIGPSKRHKSGVAVRFPRILRWREDKPAAEADSLETARALMTP